uniref:BAH domain-containing protein n=1 Tax=Bubo bubo TaxID=30461 RepID=A0A8C0FK94_BUBBB
MGGFDSISNYVYFENSSSNPYLIRRIEELNKTANGNVEAKVVCFYRRRDISSTLIVLADKHASKLVCVQIASIKNCQTWIELLCAVSLKPFKTSLGVWFDYGGDRTEVFG